MSTHRCPGPGCERRVPGNLLACSRHWFQVSKTVRDEVWAAYHALDGDFADEAAAERAEQRHMEAMRAAIAEMKP